MFSKRDDVTELQAVIEKKVNWHDHNLALKRLAELKQQMDTMANDIFIGHLEALRGEFNKKADKDAMNEVRARLERLEVLVAHTDARQTAAVETLREETQAKLAQQHEAHASKAAECMQAIRSLEMHHMQAVDRLDTAEAR